MIFAAVLFIIFICKGFGKESRKQAKRTPQDKEAKRNGYTATFCEEMESRGMCLKNGEWVPISGKDDREDPDFIKAMKRKDIILNSSKRWTLTGKALDKVLDNWLRDRF